MILKKERNMMNMVNTGNMPTSLKRRSGHSSKPGAAGDLAVPVLEVPVRDLVRTEAVRIGILPTARNFRAVMPVVSQTSSNRCSAAGVALADSSTGSADKTTRQNSRSL